MNASNLAAKHSTFARAAKRQTGSFLVPILIIGIILVLVLMWQAGMFSGANSASDTPNAAAPVPATSSVNNATSGNSSNNLGATQGDPESPAGAAATSPDPTTDATIDPPAGTISSLDDWVPSPTFAQEKLSAQDVAIDTAAQRILVSNRPDFSSCKGNDAVLALNCAATEQTRVLKAAFTQYNEQRANGDETSINLGGEVMKRVIQSLQVALEPFVAAADNP